MERSASRVPPGRHRRPAVRLDPALPHGQHRHRLRVGHPRPRARRTHGRRDPARLRPDHGQRRVVPVHHRHGQARSRPRPRRQVPRSCPAGYDGPDSRRLLRVGVAVAHQLADRARPARRRQARRADRELPQGPARLPALRGRRAAGDGVHLAERRRSSTPSTPTTVSFFDELDAVIQREPLGRHRRRDSWAALLDRDPQGHAVRARRPHARAADRSRRGRERHRSGHRVQDPRPRGVQVPEQPVEDGVHRRRLPLARRRRRRWPQPRRPDVVLLPRDRQHAGHGAAHSRRGFAVRLHRARQHRRVPRRRQELQAHRPARTSRPRTSGRSSSTTPRRDRSSRPANRSRARTTPATRSPRTPTARSPSRSDRPSPPRTPATGRRPCPARSGSRSCGSTARSSPGSTRRGFPARSNRSMLRTHRRRPHA